MKYVRSEKGKRSEKTMNLFEPNDTIMKSSLPMR